MEPYGDAVPSTLMPGRFSQRSLASSGRHATSVPHGVFVVLPASKRLYDEVGHGDGIGGGAAAAQRDASLVDYLPNNEVSAGFDCETSSIHPYIHSRIHLPIS